MKQKIKDKLISILYWLILKLNPEIVIPRYEIKRLSEKFPNEDNTTVSIMETVRFIDDKPLFHGSYFLHRKKQCHTFNTAGILKHNIDYLIKNGEV